MDPMMLTKLAELKQQELLAEAHAQRLADQLQPDRRPPRSWLGRLGWLALAIRRNSASERPGQLPPFVPSTINRRG